MKKVLLFSFLFFLVGCQDTVSAPTTTETIIDWVDFIKINDQQYAALYTTAIAEDKYIGEEVGVVKFKVDENITDPNYMVKEGDAAFWEKGTTIYAVKDMPDLIAVKDQQEINGYRIYQAENIEENWSFDHINRETVKKIEIQKGYTNPEIIKTLSNKSEINELINLLENGKERTKFDPTEEDPERFYIVFYSDQPVVSYYPLIHARDVWYWHPWEEEILPDEIGEIMGEH